MFTCLIQKDNVSVSFIKQMSLNIVGRQRRQRTVDTEPEHMWWISKVAVPIIAAIIAAIAVVMAPMLSNDKKEVKQQEPIPIIIAVQQQLPPKRHQPSAEVMPQSRVEPLEKDRNKTESVTSNAYGQQRPYETSKAETEQYPLPEGPPH